MTWETATVSQKWEVKSTILQNFTVTHCSFNQLISKLHSQ